MILLPDRLDGHTVVHREDWGAAPPRSRTFRRRDQVTEFILHVSTGEELGRTDHAAWVRAIQHYHQTQRNYADIAYNALVATDGTIFEGRPFDVVGGHTEGHNTVGYAVCFLGDDDPGYDDAPKAARSAIRALAHWANATAGRTLRLLGHRDTKSTACPGVELWTWLHEGMPVPDDFDFDTAVIFDPASGFDEGVARTLGKALAFKALPAGHDEKVRRGLLVGKAASVTTADATYEQVERIAGKTRLETAAEAAERIHRGRAA